MKSSRILSVVCALVLSACSGAGGGASGGGGGVSLPPSHLDLAQTMFVFAPMKQSASRAKYVTASVASVTISLNTVNGSAPPAGLTTTVTTNITLSACPCNVPGPSVPPGSDAFTLATYDSANGGGNVVSKATATYTITAGQTNSNTITLNGVPASLSITGLPAATAGTPFGSAQAFAVAAKDADGNTILGNYANPVSLTDADSTGATTLGLSTLNGSSDTPTLNYTGLAIPNATIMARATGASSAAATFTPTLQPIAWTCTQSGGCSSSANEIDLYATSGTGSTFTFTASEVGWTNAPFNQSLDVALAAGCASIATVSPSSGTSFTVTVVASPAAGTCALTLSDSLGQAKSVTLTYTTSGIGVN